MSRYSDKLKIFCLSLAVIFCAGLVCFASASERSADLKLPSAEPLSAPSADASARTPASAVKNGQSPAPAMQSDRDDLIGGFPFEDETRKDENETQVSGNVIEMGKDFQIDGMKPAGGKVRELLPNDKVTDCLWNLNDCRAYSISVPERGVICIDFNYTFSEIAGTPWVVYLYEAYASDGGEVRDAYRRLDMFTVTSVETRTQVNGAKIGIYPGEYIVLVRAGDVCSVDDYTLQAQFTRGIAWEAEPNDTVTRYTELPFGIKTGGTCSEKTGGDTDWFLIDLPKRGVIDLVFEHADEQLPQVGWFVTLQNQSGDILYQTRSFYSDTVNDSGEIGLDAGIYYIKITPHIQIDTDYYITCTYEAIDSYETEMNDTLETADLIPLNGEECGISGSISDRTVMPDKDCYRFEPDRAGVMSFSFVHKDFTRNRDGWDIRLLNEEGKEIYHTVSRWCDMAVSSPQIGLDKGVYYLVVDGENMLLNSGTYVIGINYAYGDDWESEINNTFETADRVELNKKTYGALIATATEYDTDMFVLELAKNTPVQLEFCHNGYAQSYEGWVVTLYNANAELITSFSSKWSDAKITSDMINLAKGTYYIAVDTGARFSDLKYSVEVKG